jgi:hypothetical protein
MDFTKNRYTPTGPHNPVMKTIVRRTALTSIAILLLLGGTSAAFATSPRTLNMTIPVGGVTNLGTQIYNVSGGVVGYAEVLGQTLDPGATLQYNLVATQIGLRTDGYASVTLTGTTGGVPITMRGTFRIVSSVPGAVIGNSEVPFYFVTDTANVQVTIAGQTQTIPESINIENPYFNPFGMPIVMGSADGYIGIVATYNQGTILWMGSQVTGPLVGTLGSKAVSGTLTLNGGELENLVAGTAQDAGTMSFTGMTPSSLNTNGAYTGSSTIPAPGQNSDCSYTTGIEGTCTETGFQSTGSFTAGSISGSYTTTWSAPAVTFSTSITATVAQSGAQSSNYGQH